MELKEDAKESPVGVQYERLVVPLLEKVKQQEKRLNDLEKRLAKLEGK